MAIAYIGERAAGVLASITSTQVITPTANTVAGHTLFLVFSMNNSTRTVTGVTDTAGGNTWAVDVSASANTRTVSICSVFLNTAILTSHTITATLSGMSTSGNTWWLEEFSGVLSASFLDKTATAAWASGTAADSGTTATTTQADEVAITGFCWGAAGATFTDSSGYSAFTTGVQTSSSMSGMSKYLIVSATGAQREQATVDSASGEGAIATYKAAAATQVLYSQPCNFQNPGMLFKRTNWLWIPRRFHLRRPEFWIPQPLTISGMR